MKKLSFFLVALVAAFNAYAQDVEPKEAIKGEVSP